MDMWLKTLNLEIRGNELVMYNNVGKGYFLLSNNENDAIHYVVMLPPFEIGVGNMHVAKLES